MNPLPTFLTDPLSTEILTVLFSIQHFNSSEEKSISIFPFSGIE